MRSRSPILVLVAAGAMLITAGGAHPAAAQSAFYQASPAEIAGPPGSIIRTEPMGDSWFGARTLRVLYRSTGLKGEPIAVSGAVIVPGGTPPPGGWPVVGWAHPTTGIVPRCAPTLAIFFFQQIPGLRMMLEHGFAIAATDYPGLGTPGPHPYLVGDSEGRAVLDSIRAAHELPGASISTRSVLWGHSQGGQAVLFAAKLAALYSPDLTVLGVVAAAPATELSALMRDDIATAGGKNLLAMTLWSWDRVFGAPMSEIVVAEAVPDVDRLANICLESIIDIRPRQIVGKELTQQFLKVKDPTAMEPWKRLLAENTIGTLPPSLPVLIAQGAADVVVDPPVTAAYAKLLCAAGSRVAMLSYPGVGHGMISRDAAKPSVDWMADRFAGRGAPSDCNHAD
ncbi:alpha/beta fold hydrolase [Hyphomicrobium sp. B1]|uniref:alpha/beta fold hydrolase n=1 Tax=Hyphomicrobium sp. B1 TaxID=3075651 RepID=UPI003C2CA944